MSIRTILSGLTVRSRCLIGAGSTAVLCGMVLGQRDLVRAGALLIALPLVCVLVVGRARVTIDGSRGVSTSLATVGDPVEVTLRIVNGGLLPVAGLMIDDRLPAAAGRGRGAPDDRRARFALGVLRAGHSSDISYPVPQLPRGRFTLGPMGVRLSDPFGMVELTRSFTATNEIAILPRIAQLPRHAMPGGREELGGSAVHAVGSLGASDLTVREYRHGDDLRKIHWRSSARTGELMVRQEERPWQGDVTVLVDARDSQHRGVGPRSSFEWMVSGAASIAEHLTARGYRVTILGGQFSSQWPTTGGAETLADLQLATQASLISTVGMSTIRDRSPERGAVTLIALVAMPAEAPDGRLLTRDAEALGEIPAAARMLIGVRTSTWESGRESPRTAGRGRAAAGPTVGDLEIQGWRVATAVRGDAIAQVWSAMLTSLSPLGAR